VDIVKLNQWRDCCDLSGWKNQQVSLKVIVKCLQEVSVCLFSYILVINRNHFTCYWNDERFRPCARQL